MCIGRLGISAETLTKKKSEERKRPKREEKLKMGKDKHRTVLASLREKKDNGKSATEIERFL